MTKTAEMIVKSVGSITGLKRATHRKGPFQTLSGKLGRKFVKARDLIRTLQLQEFRTPQEKTELETYLKVCFDRLLRLGLSSIPSSFDEHPYPAERSNGGDGYPSD